MPIDTSAVLQRLDGEAFIKELYPDSPVADSRGEVRIFCPFHADQSTPNLDFNVVKKLYRCTACHSTGSAIDLLAARMNVARRVALEHLARALGVTGRPPVEPQVVEQHHANLKHDPTLLAMLLAKKGIDLMAVERWRLGWIPDEKRLTIPIRNELGEIINLRKYDLLKVHERKYESLNKRGGAVLYPREALGPDMGDVHFTEGELKMIGLRQLGVNAMTSTGGAGTWRDEWAAEFKGKRVFICYDIDEAGQRGAALVATKLRGLCPEVRIIQLPLDIEKHPHGDVLDWLLEGHTAAEYQALASIAPLAQPNVPVDTKDAVVYEVELGEASSAGFAYKRIVTSIIISAKDTAPYVVPSEVGIKCTQGHDYCEGCPVAGSLSRGEGDLIGTLKPDDPGLLELIDIPKEKLERTLKQQLGIPSTCKTSEVVVYSHLNLEEVRLVPQLTESTNTEQVVVRAYHAGHGIEPNATYEIEARATTDPRDQHATLLIYRATPNVDNLSTFSPAEDLLEELDIFRPADDSLESLDAKLDDIYDDLASNVTHIVRRPEMHAMIDLMYHSMLYIPLDGELQRGWVEALIIGDSGQGKSHTAEHMMKHYRLGTKIDMKGASVAGLKGGLMETQGRWFVQWGAIPLADRGAALLDEVKGASTEVIQALTDMRSSGFAELTKIERRRTYARTRKLWVSNARSDRGIETYNFGVQAIKELMGSLEDVRRFDLAMVVASNEVPSEEINAPRTSNVEHRFTSDRCRRLILWAWSRQPEQVTFEPAALDACRELAISQGKRYSSSIPLVEPADHRLKLARLAAALAARTFSTTEDRQTLVVREAHVRWIAGLLNQLYASRFMGYAEYSDVRALDDALDSNDTVKHALLELSYPLATVRGLMRTPEVRPGDLMDWSDLGRDEAKALLSLLVRNNALQRKQHNYYKTGPFIELLRLLQRDLEQTAGHKTVRDF